MKIWRVSSFGIEKLEQVDVAMPVAGAGQVVVKIHAVSLNFRDLLMVEGKYNPKMAMPRIPCSDGAGEIVEVGSGVTRVKTGDRVAGIFMQNWLEGEPNMAKQRGALGGDIDGMLAEYVVLSEEGVTRLPEHLSWEEAATLPCAGVTAWNAVVNAGKVRPGATVVVQGTGGVSIFALQFAKLLGARVLGTSSSDEKLERAKTFGLDAGLNYRKTADWASWVLDETDGEGAELIAEVGGSGTLSQSLKAVKNGGMIAQIGVLAHGDHSLDIGPLLYKHVALQGIYVGSREHFEAMNRAISLSEIKPVVDHVFSFGEAKEALKFMQVGGHFGKIVIQVTT